MQMSKSINLVEDIRMELEDYQTVLKKTGDTRFEFKIRKLAHLIRILKMVARRRREEAWW